VAEGQSVAPPSDTHVDNGILARVPSQFIGKALMTLPEAALAPDGQMHVEVDAG
jgi:hypothetical protein